MRDSVCPVNDRPLHYLSAQEVADILGVSSEHVRSLYRSRRLRGHKIGHRTIRFTAEDVQEFVEGRD